MATSALGLEPALAVRDRALPGNTGRAGGLLRDEGSV
jgi:hypothetical protein